MIKIKIIKIKSFILHIIVFILITSITILSVKSHTNHKTVTVMSSGIQRENQKVFCNVLIVICLKNNVYEFTDLEL